MDNKIVKLEEKIDSMERKIRNLTVACILIPTSISGFFAISNAATEVPIHNIPNINIESQRPKLLGNLKNKALRPEDAKFGTLEVNELIIKDRAGKKILLSLGRGIVDEGDDMEHGLIHITSTISRGIARLTDKFIEIETKGRGRSRLSSNGFFTIYGKHAKTSIRVDRNGSKMTLKSAYKNHDIRLQSTRDTSTIKGR